MTPYTEKENFYIISFRIDLIKKKCINAQQATTMMYDIDARK